MPDSKNSGRSLLSRPAASVALCFILSAAVMAASTAFVFQHGFTLRYGDAEAHLNIARRIVDSRTPGWYQVGTVWLPLPHLLTALLVMRDDLWTTGLAGAIPAALCMTIAATFFFAGLRRLFGTGPALAGTAVFLLNPNMLYLGSIPMTEPVFFAALSGFLYFSIRFSVTRGWGCVLGAGIAALAATATRYEGWMLIPLVALFLLASARWHPAKSVVFSLLASAGPVLWLLHNRWYFGNALEFYNGPYSALAIQHNVAYPGKNDWLMAARYFFTAGTLIAGWPAILLGAAGVAMACVRKVFWPVILLLAPCVFYVMSIHSSGVPLFVPTLWPNTMYNTRYAVAFIPLIGLGVAAISRGWKWGPSAAPSIALVPFLLHPTVPPITWQESDINSRARIEWTQAAAEYLKAEMRPGDGILTTFGDVTGIFRMAGIPLRNTLTASNVIEWAEVTTHPDFFLREEWAVVTSGDALQTMLDRLRLRSPRYELQRRIIVKGAPVIEIYRRQPDPLPSGAATANDEDTVY